MQALMKSPVKTTAVIVNWNKCVDLINLLDSLRSINYSNLNIIVVDNASTDGSVDAIRNHCLPLKLIENKENLGGTGGFNTGVRYALDNLEQEYLWLLDNDATVDSGALAALVKVMEEDPSIALAGSKILNKFAPEYIVETGARIDWHTVSVLPFNRNVVNRDNEPTVIDVEYVAICSALLRDKAVREIGLMDKRYFLLWDDMDWGLSFRQGGYRVVAVNDSLIFHPPFTEKRSMVVDNYYGIRNALLTASKHAAGASLCWAVLTLCRRAAQLYWLTGLDRQSDDKHLSLYALADFLFNRWGKLSRFGRLMPDSERSESILPWSSLHNGRILVLNSGSASDINNMISLLENNCGSSVAIDLVIQADRSTLVKARVPGEVIEVDFEAKYALLRNFRVFLRLQSRKYMLAVKPSDDRISPFAYVAPRLARYDSATQSLIGQRTHPFWKVCLAIVVSELAAVALFPIVLIRSYLYRMAK
jgi:GT2 family glycosyltransferase